MENFKNKYRKIDCLIIDDIQFLEKRERTLEEFFIPLMRFTKKTNKL